MALVLGKGFSSRLDTRFRIHTTLAQFFDAHGADFLAGRLDKVAMAYALPLLVERQGRIVPLRNQRALLLALTEFRESVLRAGALKAVAHGPPDTKLPAGRETVEVEWQIETGSEGPPLVCQINYFLWIQPDGPQIEMVSFGRLDIDCDVPSGEGFALAG